MNTTLTDERFRSISLPLAPDSVAKALQTADQHCRTGALDQAATVYRQILELQPANVPALMGAAATAYQLRDFPTAVELARKGFRANPSDVSFANLMGRAFKALGKLDEAAEAYEESIRVNPQQVDTLVSLGIALRARGDFEGALAAYRRALEIDPDSGVALHNLGNTLLASGDARSARQSYQRAIAADPKLAESHFELANLDMLAEDRNAAREGYRRAVDAGLNSAQAALRVGKALLSLGDRDPACFAFMQAATLEPSNQEALFLFGRTLYERRDFDAATAVLARAAQLAPDFADAHVNLGVALRGRGAYEQAEASYRRALELEPGLPAASLGLSIMDHDFGRHELAKKTLTELVGRLPSYLDAWLALTTVCKELSDYRGAFAASDKALQLKPNLAQAHMNHGALLLPCGDARGALKAFQEAKRLDPSSIEAWQNALSSLDYLETDNPGDIVGAHAEFGRVMLPPDTGSTPAPGRTSRQRIRVGYLSPDLFSHSVSYFLEPVLTHHDKSEFEVFCYHVNWMQDETTRRLQSCADHWRDCARVTDSELQRLIVEDDLDVLIDLAGHTRGSRVRVLAARCAPVQIVWLGYPTTSGVPTIDYRLTDPVIDPPGYEKYSTERLLRLETSYYCYRAPEDAPPPSAPPASGRGIVTFGSFNNLAKLTDATVALWSAALCAVPDSLLVLKSPALSDDDVRRKTTERFAAHGVDTSRLELLGRVRGVRPHLEHYGRIDIALDTYPYNGATTTCEALWMGVPVVTRTGCTHAARMGASILGAARLPELIADSDARFVEICVDFASDAARLSKLREGMREHLAGSPLTDAVAFTRGFESAIRKSMNRQEEML